MDIKLLQSKNNDSANYDTIIKREGNYFDAKNNNPFHSFWMAGFECTDQINAFGNRVDLINTTGHLEKLDEDYKNLGMLSMATVREGIRWSHVEKKPYQYDFSVVEAMILVAKQNNIQQVWDICHFGFPDDLTPLHPMFARRFAALCKAFVTFYRNIDKDGVLIITPINEVSFLSWLGGDVRGTSPFCVGQGWEVKYSLMKAYIEGVEAILAVDASVRILTTEPLVNIIPPPNATIDEILAAASLHEDQFQVTDILSGAICPELRGKPEYLDILGYNYYYNNQWAIATNQFIHWNNNDADDRFIPLHQLLEAAHRRYNRPIVLTETSHPKEDRPLWIEMIAEQTRLALDEDIPLWGICWYPIIDRPDWDNLTDWHQSGIWDILAEDQSTTHRTLHKPTADALLQAQFILSNTNNVK